MTESPLKVLIVDDEALARKRIRAMAAGDCDLQVVGECSNGYDAISSITEVAPDLVFLDIDMPGLDGLGVVRCLSGNLRPLFIFVTAYPKHGLAAFEMDAVDYLLKPFDASRFQTAVSRARSRNASRAARSTVATVAEPDRGNTDGTNYLKQLAIRKDGAIVPLRVKDVDWIEADRNYVRLHIGENSYQKREAIGNIERHLDPATFRRVNRSAIVNLERIAELRPCSSGEYQVILQNGMSVLLTQTCHKNLSEFLG